MVLEATPARMWKLTADATFPYTSAGLAHDFPSRCNFSLMACHSLFIDLCLVS
jgi:hypothetical protein